jgi:hypothetical protein
MNPITVDGNNLRNAGVPLDPGDKLPNGATLLAQRRIWTGMTRVEWIVLAMTGNKHNPFVTWHRLLTTDTPLADGEDSILDTCAFGHYHERLDEALEEFEARTTMELGRREEMIES